MNLSKMELQDVIQLAQSRIKEQMTSDIDTLYNVIEIHLFSIGYDDNDQIYYDHTSAIITVALNDTIDDFINKFISKEQTVKTYTYPKAFIKAWGESSKKDNDHYYTAFSE